MDARKAILVLAALNAQVLAAPVPAAPALNPFAMDQAYAEGSSQFQALPNLQQRDEAVQAEALALPVLGNLGLPSLPLPTAVVTALPLPTAGLPVIGTGAIPLPTDLTLPTAVLPTAILGTTGLGGLLPTSVPVVGASLPLPSGLVSVLGGGGLLNTTGLAALTNGDLLTGLTGAGLVPLIINTLSNILNTTNATVKSLLASLTTPLYNLPILGPLLSSLTGGSTGSLPGLNSLTGTLTSLPGVGPLLVSLSGGSTGGLSSLPTLVGLKGMVRLEDPVVSE